MKELKQAVQDGNVLIGADQVIKALKKSGLKEVVVAKNCPAALKKDIDLYAGLANVPVTQADMNNEELGVFCKKNFFISVIGVK